MEVESYQRFFQRFLYEASFNLDNLDAYTKAYEKPATVLFWTALSRTERQCKNNVYTAYMPKCTSAIQHQRSFLKTKYRSHFMEM